MTDAWDGHQLLLASAHDLDAGCAEWAARGLAAREKMLYVADGAHPDAAALVSALEGRGVDIAAAADAGLLEVVEPHEFYVGAGAVRMVDEARGLGHPNVRVFSHADAGREWLSPTETDAFERALDAMWSGQGVTCLCRYEPAAMTGSDDLDAAFDRHGSGWGDALLHAHRPGPARLVLEGEADITNAATFSMMIRTAGRGATAGLVVDCLGLRFVSVGAWRAAAAAGRELGERAAVLELSGLSRTQVHTVRRLRLDGFFDIRQDG